MSAAAARAKPSTPLRHHRSRGVMQGVRGVPWANGNGCWPNARDIAVVLEVWIEAIISAIRGPRSMRLRERLGNATS